MDDCENELPEDHSSAASDKPSEKLWTGSFIAIIFINFFNFFCFNLLTTGMPLYIDALGGSTIEIGLVVTMVTISALIVRPFTGVLIDNFGRRGIMIASMVYMFIIIVGYAVFPVVGLLLSLRFLHGIGWGFSGTAISTTASDLLPKTRFAEGMGFLAMSNSVAVAIAPSIAISLMGDFGATPMISVACFSLGVAIILTLLIHFPKVELKKKEFKRIHLSDLIERNALLPGLLIGLTNVAFSTISAFVAIYGQEQGVSEISLYFVAYALTTIVTRPLLGRVIDRIGFYWPGILACLGVAATMMLISVSTNLLMFIAAGILAGFGLGTSMGVFQTMAVSKAKPERRGVANSTYFLMFDLGMCTGSLIAGVICNYVGYSITYMIMAIAPLLAAIIIIACGKKRVDTYSVNLSANE